MQYLFHSEIGCCASVGFIKKLCATFDDLLVEVCLTHVEYALESPPLCDQVQRFEFQPFIKAYGIHSKHTGRLSTDTALCFVTEKC